MAAEIQGRYPGAVVKLIMSKGGRFEVMRDGVAVFEKSKAGRHAEPGEILRTLEKQGSGIRGQGSGTANDA